MKIYTLRTAQKLPINIDSAWSFFSNPANLHLITPKYLDMKFSSDLPSEIYPDLLITYSVRPILGLPIKWVTEITYAQKPHYFLDEQCFGPYKFWRHQHHFITIDGGVEMTDVVNYALPFWVLGRIAHGIFVQRQLLEIFKFRRDFLQRHFGLMPE